MPIQQLLRAPEVVLGEGLLQELHVRGVGFLPGGQFSALRTLPLMIDAINGDGRTDRDGEQQESGCSDEAR